MEKEPQKITDLRATVSSLNDEKSSLVSDINSLNQDKSLISEELNILNLQKSEVQQRVSVLEATHHRLTMENYNLEVGIRINESRIKASREELKKVEEKLSALKVELDTFEKNKLKLIALKKQQLGVIDAKLKGANKLLAEVEESIIQHIKKLKSVEESIDKALSDKKKLDEEKISFVKEQKQFRSRVKKTEADLKLKEKSLKEMISKYERKEEDILVVVKRLKKKWETENPGKPFPRFKWPDQQT